MLLIDWEALKNPGAHTSHAGCAVVLPAVLVYLPGEHFVCAMQELAFMPLLDVEVTVKNPLAHTLHEAVESEYLPGGQGIFVIVVMVAGVMARGGGVVAVTSVNMTSKIFNMGKAFTCLIFAIYYFVPAVISRLSRIWTMQCKI